MSVRLGNRTDRRMKSVSLFLGFTIYRNPDAKVPAL